MTSSASTTQALPEPASTPSAISIRSQLIAATLIIGAAVAAIMHRWLFFDGVPVTFRGENVPEINYIWTLRQMIEAGHPFSLWQSKFLGGEALATHGAYPLYWSLAAISSLFDWPVERLYIWADYLVFVIGGLGSCVLTRKLTGQIGAGIVAGCIFSLIPGHLNAIEGFYLQLSWMLIPWAFWMVERRCDKPILHARDALGPGVLMGVLLLLSIQMPMMMLPFVLVYVLMREWQSWNTQSAIRNRSTEAHERPQSAIGNFVHWWQQRGWVWLLSGLLGAGISIGYYLPTALELNEVGWSRFVADPLGLPLDLGFLWFLLTYRWSPEMTVLRWHHISWYIGGAALIFGLIGVFTHLRKRILWVYLLLGLFALFVLVGESLGSIPNLVYQIVEVTPFFNGVLRRTFRFILPVSFFLSVLAGFGVAAIYRWLRIRTLVVGLSVAVLLAGVILGDYWLHRGSFRTFSTYLEPERVALVDWLNAQPSEGMYFIPFEYGKTEDGYLRSYHLTAMHHQIKRSGIWDDSYVGHFVSRRADELMQIVITDHPLWSDTFSPLLSTMFDVAGVRYLIFHVDVPEQQKLIESIQQAGYPLVFEQGKLRVFENVDTRPSVQIWPSAIRYVGAHLPTDFSQWLPLSAERNLVLIEGNDSQIASATQSVATLDGLAALPVVTPLDPALDWQRPSPSRIEVQTTLAQPATVVLTESWYPGWSVRVDGEEKPLLRANYAFMGVQLAAGRHSLVFQYRPRWYVWLGWGLSLLTWLAVVGLRYKLRK